MKSEGMGNVSPEVVTEEGVMLNTVHASLFILASLLVKLENPFA